MLHPRKSQPKLATIDSTAISFAMLGIVLTLLVIGSVMAPPFDCRGPDVPRVLHPVAMYRAERADAMRIAIARDGQIYLGNEPTNEIRMVQELKTRLSRGAERKLYISAETRTRYSNVSKVLDAAASAGIHEIGFLTEQRKDVSK